MSDPLVNAMTQAVEGQNLYHGRHGTTPAGSATARAILAHLRDLGWTVVAAPPSDPAALLREAVDQAVRQMEVEFAYLEADKGRVVSGGVAARIFRPMAAALRAALTGAPE